MNKIIVPVCFFLCALFLPVDYAAAQSVEDEAFFKQRSASIDETIGKLVTESRETEVQKKLASLNAPSFDNKVFSPSPFSRSILPAAKRDVKIAFEFDNAGLEDVFKIIAEAADMNIILDPALKDKKVDFHLKELPLEDGMRLLFNAYDLDCAQVNNSFYISLREKIKRDNLSSRLIKLENLSVEEAQVLIKGLIDVVNVSKEINSLILRGSPEELSQVEEILKKADTPQPLVMLETRVIEINRDALSEIGVDWSDSINLNFQETAVPVTLADTAIKVDKFYNISSFARSAVQFDAVIRMLENENKAKVLSNPRVTTLNNKESQIFVGDRIPYTVTTVTGGVATTEVRFSEPGIRLKITPSIVEKDFVVIKISPEVSYIYTWRGPSDQYPWVKTREATAYVRVKNGETFVLGGLLTQGNTDNIYRVPVLGKIPVLGKAFSYKKNTYSDSELIITVTPTIMSGGA